MLLFFLTQICWEETKRSEVQGLYMRQEDLKRL